MTIIRRPAAARGHAHHGWLESWHTFSFGDYRDPDHMGFGSLRVINEDIVQPGQGFATHSHRDMEIVTYVLSGALAHRDGLGNASVLRPGDVQRMTAGRGITHSEYNDDQQEPVHLLQIWILPQERGLEPAYQEKHFPATAREGRLCLLAAPGGIDDALHINQDARVLATLLAADQQVAHTLEPGRRAWVQVARGKVRVNDVELAAGDGAAVTGGGVLALRGVAAAELLLFDLG
jgi:quercetin 2,3-dioxygenase